jgi:hypothetical protein
MLARERAFLENFESITARQVEIPDHVVDTKSNLSSLVLKRNLYQLGMRFPVVAAHAGKIDRLLGMRNAIAHGDKLKIPKDADVREYLQASFDVMRFVQEEVFESLRDKIYQRDPATDFGLALPANGIFQRAMSFVRSVGGQG